MKATKGYAKEYYKNSSPVYMEFDSLEAAAEYLSNKFKSEKQAMVESILSEANGDAILFDDGSVVLCELC